MTQPHRRFRLTLCLEADDREELVSALKHIVFLVATGQLTRGVSGGPSSGYTYELVEDAEQTHDRYFAQLHEHLAKIEGE